MNEIDLNGFIDLLKRQTKTYWSFSLEKPDYNNIKNNHLIIDTKTYFFKGPDELMTILKFIFKIDKFDDLNIFFNIPEECCSISFFYSKYFDSYNLFLYKQNEIAPYKNEGDDFLKAYTNLIINFMLKS